MAVWGLSGGLGKLENQDAAPSSNHFASRDSFPIFQLCALVGHLGKRALISGPVHSHHRAPAPRGPISRLSTTPPPSPAALTFPNPKNSHSHLHMWLALLHYHCDRQNV